MDQGPPRCAAHPARPAAGPCGRCGRGRCASDAADAATRGADGCLLCRPAAVPGRVPPGERLVRAGLAVAVAVPLLGAVSSQYVDAAGWSLAVPALSGVLLAEGATRAAGRGAPAALARTAVAVAVLGAVLAAAAAFALAPGRTSLVAPPGRVLPPYAVAAAAAALWGVSSRRPARPRLSAPR